MIWVIGVPQMVLFCAKCGWYSFIRKAATDNNHVIWIFSVSACTVVLAAFLSLLNSSVYLNQCLHTQYYIGFKDDQRCIFQMQMAWLITWHKVKMIHLSRVVCNLKMIKVKPKGEVSNGWLTTSFYMNWNNIGLDLNISNILCIIFGWLLHWLGLYTCKWRQ